MHYRLLILCLLFFTTVKIVITYFLDSHVDCGVIRSNTTTLNKTHKNATTSDVTNRALTVKLFGPLLWLQSRWRISGNEEQSSHWVEITQRRLGLSHFKSCDPQRPQVTSVVICGIWVLITRDHFRCHPVGCTNESVAPSNCTIQLCTHTKIDWWRKSAQVN